VLTVVGLATWPISGHPAVTSVPVLTTVVDAAHLAAMAVWLGGLVVLFGFLLPRANARELAAVLPVWSRWAMTAVTVLVIAGTAQALVSLGSVSGLYATTYGRLILLKVGVLALVLAVAWYSRRLVLGPLSGNSGLEAGVATGDDGPPARRRLRRSVLLELAGTLVILGLASALVQTTPARAAQQEATRRDTGDYTATLTTKLYTLQVQLEPKTVGANTIHLYAFTPNGGASLPVKEWKATAALPAKGVEPVAMPILPVTDDHAIAQAQLPTAGAWELRFTLRTTDIDEASVVAEVPIK
jgi:copper transport protein